MTGGLSESGSDDFYLLTHPHNRNFMLRARTLLLTHHRLAAAEAQGLRPYPRAAGSGQVQSGSASAAIGPRGGGGRSLTRPAPKVIVSHLGSLPVDCVIVIIRYLAPIVGDLKPIMVRVLYEPHL